MAAAEHRRMAPSPRGGFAARAYVSRRASILPRLACMLIALAVFMRVKADWAPTAALVRGESWLGRGRAASRGGSRYADDWKRLRDALNARSKPREFTVAPPPPTREVLSLAEPRIMDPKEVEKLVTAVRNRRRPFANCSVVGNDSSMRDAALGGDGESDGDAVRFHAPAARLTDDRASPGTSRANRRPA